MSYHQIAMSWSDWFPKVLGADGLIKKYFFVGPLEFTKVCLIQKQPLECSSILFPDFQISRRRRGCRRRWTNSQFSTWPLSQRTQGSNTSHGAFAAMKLSQREQSSAKFSTGSTSTPICYHLNFSEQCCYYYAFASLLCCTLATRSPTALGGQG